MKDIGKTTYILGVKISRDEERKILMLSQEPYTLRIFWAFSYGWLQANRYTYYKKGRLWVLKYVLILYKSVRKWKMGHIWMPSKAWCIRWCVQCQISIIQLDWYADINQTWKRNINSYKKNTCLKRTIDYSLCCQGSDMRLVWYANTDWGSDLDERKFTSGYDLYLAMGLFLVVAKSRLA